MPGCRYGSSGFGLCMRHRSAWTRGGRPDPAAWAARQPGHHAVEHAECGLPFCTLWCENAKNLFCKSHETRWRQLGRPDVEDFVAHCLLRGRARIDFRGLAPQLRLELQYAVQCRHDQPTITAPPPVVNWAIRQVNAAGVASLLDSPGAMAGADRGQVRRLVSGVPRWTPATSSRRCARAPAGRSSTPATSGGCTRCPG